MMLVWAGGEGRTWKWPQIGFYLHRAMVLERRAGQQSAVSRSQINVFFWKSAIYYWRNTPAEHGEKCNVFLNNNNWQLCSTICRISVWNLEVPRVNREVLTTRLEFQRKTKMSKTNVVSKRDKHIGFLHASSCNIAYVWAFKWIATAWFFLVARKPSPQDWICTVN